MGLNFYNVDTNYTDYLRQFEPQIPNIEYKDRDKFLCGIVLTVNNMNYYVPVSSNKTRYASSFLIFDKDSPEKQCPISSLRFSFMFPCPIETISVKILRNEPDAKYKKLMQKEYEYCNKHTAQIRKQAARMYNLSSNPTLRQKYHLNNFKLLEEKCTEYMQK